MYSCFSLGGDPKRVRALSDRRNQPTPPHRNRGEGEKVQFRKTTPCKVEFWTINPLFRVRCFRAKLPGASQAVRAAMTSPAVFATWRARVSAPIVGRRESQLPGYKARPHCQVDRLAEYGSCGRWCRPFPTSIPRYGPVRRQRANCRLLATAAKARPWHR